MKLLAFETPCLEQAFLLRCNRGLLRMDWAWALFWLFFAAVSMGKTQLSTLSPTDVLMWVGWAVWGPVVLYLLRYRSAWYLRHRIAVVAALRLTRFVVMAGIHMSRMEAGWMDLLPSTPFQVYSHLFWKVNSLLGSAVAFVIPMRWHIPLHLTTTMLSLYLTNQRCQLECSGGVGGGLGALGSGAAVPACGAATSGMAAAASAGSCTAPSAADVERYYGAALWWIRCIVPGGAGFSHLRLRLPIGRLLPAAWRWPLLRGGCLAQCFSVHAWLQVVGGSLLPLLGLWAYEERLRLAELSLWVEQEEGEEEEQQLQAGPPPRQQPSSTTVGLQKPLSLLTLVAWFVSTTWLLWLLHELVLL